MYGCPGMVEVSGKPAVQTNWELVQRILASSRLNKSARLSELFSYLCDRVLDHNVQTINELELGHNVFGRAARYDTTADNIVRVHASLLRKRLTEYFQTEGRNEEIVIEIPRGNYAPVFRRRSALEHEDMAGFHAPGISLGPATTAAAVLGDAEPPQRSTSFASPPSHRFAWALAIPIACSVIFAVTSVLLYMRLEAARSIPGNPTGVIVGPVARLFWSSVFSPHLVTDVIVDDASVGFYTEATGNLVPIGDYFDRTYIRTLITTPGPPEHDPNWLHQLVIRRLSNYAVSSMTWKLAEIAGAEQGDARLAFARDFGFRQAKTDNLVLLGTPSANPWIQLFDGYTTLHWGYDTVEKAFFPVDSTIPDPTRYKAQDPSKTREGYATVALLPNLGGTGKVLILSGSGGSASDAVIEWLTQDASLQLLRSRLPPTTTGGFPYFEALLRVEKGTDRPRSVVVAICRPVRSAHAGAAH